MPLHPFEEVDLVEIAPQCLVVGPVESYLFEGVYRVFGSAKYGVYLGRASPAEYPQALVRYAIDLRKTVRICRPPEPLQLTANTRLFITGTGCAGALTVRGAAAYSTA